MCRSLLMRFIAIIIATSLLIFIEYKFEVIDYLRFVNSAKSVEGFSVAYSSDGEMIAVGKKSTSSQTGKNKKLSKKVQIEIRRVKDNSLITSIDSLTTRNLTFSPDNSLIAAGSEGGKVYVWRVSDGELIHSFDHEINMNSSRMRYFLFTRDGQSIVTFIFGSLSKVNVWNLANETKRLFSVEFNSAALSPGGEILALGNRDNRTVDLYRLEDMILLKQLEVGRKPYAPLKLSPDGKKMAFTGHSPPAPPEDRYGYSIYFHNIEDGSLSTIFYHPTKESLENFAISPDGHYLAAFYRRSVPSSFFVGAPKLVSDARFYGRIRVWRIADGKQLATFRGHKRRTTSIIFSPDSKFLVSTGWDGKIRFWKMPPRNYSRFWIFGGICFAALVYWQRTSLINWISR